MTLGSLGLGLIGGSFAKVYHEAGWQVLALDADPSTQEFAQLSGAVDGPLTDDKLASCDLILLAAYPAASIAYFQEKAHLMGPRPVVIDCCGTKRVVCSACFPVAKEHGVTFLGGHPMAGTHNSGFKYARANLFHSAPMVLVPMDRDDITLLDRAKALLAPAGFGRFSITGAPEHDEMIAFTSQMAHVISNGYIKSPTAGAHKGFSAGSYKDMTRVAWLAPQMWAELFLENKDFLLKELDFFMASMQQYRDALAADDQQELVRLLDEGRKRKAEVDGR